MRTPALILLGSLLVACASDAQQTSEPTQSPSAQAQPEAAESTQSPEPPKRSCEQLPGHRYEAIELPPEFAPTLPRGMEELWFAPGMFKAEAPDYFTYSFSLRFEEAQPASAYETILHTYFSGLMSAVAKGKDRVHASGATQVELRSLDQHLSTNCRADDCVNAQTYFVATIHTVDEFVTGKAITLYALMELSSSCARVLVQPTPRGSDLQIAQSIAEGARPAWPCLRCDTLR